VVIANLPIYLTDRPKSLRNHTQRSAYLPPDGSFKISNSKDEYAIYYDPVYRYGLNVIGESADGGL
jgi:hypothetical protein